MTVAYLRVSTEKQVLENQKAEILKFSALKGLSVDRWVTEVVSGKKQRKDRMLGRLLKTMRPGDVLIVTEISRLSRTLYDIMGILNDCMKRNIVIYSTKDGYAFDDSINSKVLAFAFGLVAEIERNLISMRTREALAMRKAAGQKLGRTKGDNYRQRIIDENKPEIVELLKHGRTVTDVCKKFQISRETFYAYKRKNGLRVD